MKDKIYIIFNRNGIRSLIKKTKAMKSLPSGNYMAELNLQVYDSFFDKQIPKFDIELQEENILEMKPKIEVEKQEENPVAMFFSKIENTFEEEEDVGN